MRSDVLYPNLGPHWPRNVSHASFQPSAAAAQDFVTDRAARATRRSGSHLPSGGAKAEDGPFGPPPVGIAQDRAHGFSNMLFTCSARAATSLNRLASQCANIFSISSSISGNMDVSSPAAAPPARDILSSNSWSDTFWSSVSIRLSMTPKHSSRLAGDHGDGRWPNDLCY
jgi:hypothetical protein